MSIKNIEENNLGIKTDLYNLNNSDINFFDYQVGGPLCSDKTN